MYQCKKCGDEFHRPGSRVPKFCSTACKDAAERKEFSVTDAYALYQAGASLSGVGEKFGVDRQTVANRFSDQGLAMRDKTWRMRHNNPHVGKKLSESTRAKISEAAKKQFEHPAARQMLRDRQIAKILAGQKQFGGHVSTLEDAVKKEMDRRGVIYQQQFAFRGTNGQFAAIADFFIDGVVVEVNGTYWHADPRCYPDGPIYASQKAAVTKYGRKIQYWESVGVKVVEIWEMDIKKDVISSVRRALEEIRPRIKAKEANQ